MAVEDRAEHRRASACAWAGDGQEQPQAPGDDLRGEAERLELRYGAVGKAGELDAMRAHDQRPADLLPAGEIEHRAALDDGAPGLLMGETGCAGDPETVVDAGERLRAG